VTVVVLSWNALRVTLDCLASLQSLESACDILVVDNGSSDGTTNAIRAAYPNVSVHQTGKNLGYAGGNNEGIRVALHRGADWVFVLNNDTTVAPDCLDRLLSAAREHPAAGVLAPTIYYHDRPQSIWSSGGLFDGRRGSATMRTDRADGPRQVDWATGCALFVRADVFARAGLFDPRFFLYYEENEWCGRVTDSGYEILHVPNASVFHKISPHEQALSEAITYYMSRNRLLFLQQRGAPVQAWVRVISEYVRTLMSLSVRRRYRTERYRRNAMMRGVTDFCLRRFGPMSTRLP
jgi:GT2 family glycosyltransferase